MACNVVTSSLKEIHPEMPQWKKDYMATSHKVVVVGVVVVVMEVDVVVVLVVVVVVVVERNTWQSPTRLSSPKPSPRHLWASAFRFVRELFAQQFKLFLFFSTKYFVL